MATNVESSGSFTASMLQSTSSGVVISTVAALVLGVGIMVALSRVGELDEKEPPLLKSSIPFCGHLLGMLKWQVGYMQMLR